jgi:hypothetical protein
MGDDDIATSDAEVRRARRRRFLTIAGIGAVAALGVAVVVVLTRRSAEVPLLLTPAVDASKGVLLEGIQHLTGGSYELGVGSSLPVQMFKDAARVAGVSSQGSMPEVAQRIVESVGQIWSTTFDSRSTPSGGGSTVTLPGLKAMQEALSIALAARQAA